VNFHYRQRRSKIQLQTKKRGSFLLREDKWILTVGQEGVEPYYNSKSELKSIGSGSSSGSSRSTGSSSASASASASAGASAVVRHRREASQQLVPISPARRVKSKHVHTDTDSNYSYETRLYTKLAYAT